MKKRRLRSAPLQDAIDLLESMYRTTVKMQPDEWCKGQNHINKNEVLALFEDVITTLRKDEE